MNNYLKQIEVLEQKKRIALTSRYPVLLPFILELKRTIRSTNYHLNPRFRTQKSKHTKWFHVTEHSSPLYRKYNTRELDNGKVTNIKIAIKSIDEIIIPPGNVFSFWKHVGKSSKKRGFKNGLVLSNGQLKEDVGGGLCQLSNLIAYMFACTECVFIERVHHSKDVFPDHNRVVPFASGATVFFNLIDVKIKNTYPFPIKINLRTTDTQLRGSLSIPVSLDYFVKLEEKESYFIKSTKTHNLYRCNKLYRVFYQKNTKNKIKEMPLWTNIAHVMYDASNLKNNIITDSDTIQSISPN